METRYDLKVISHLLRALDQIVAMDSYLVDPITPYEVVERAIENGFTLNNGENPDREFVGLCEIAAVLIKNREMFTPGTY